MANPVVIRRSGYFENDSVLSLTSFAVVTIVVPGIGMGAADAAFNLYVTACMRTDADDVGNYRTYVVYYRMTGGQIHSLDSWEGYDDADPGYDPRPLLFQFGSADLAIVLQAYPGFNHAIVDVWGVAVE
jgi:hypothetical protein